MTFNELQREYETAGPEQVGALTYAFLGRMVRAHVVAYPERIYANAPIWDEAELSDVLHEWIERLHKPAVATGEIPFAQMLQRAGGELRVLRAMLARSLSQLMDDRPGTLERRVGRVEAHNLYKRMKTILLNDKRTFVPPVGATRGAGPEHYWTLAESPATEVSRLDAVAVARIAEARTDEGWEVRWNRRPGKASRILTDERLREFLLLVLRGADGAVSLATLSQAFNIRFGVFTTVVALEDAPELRSDDDETWHNAAAQHVIERLSPDAVRELSACGVAQPTQDTDAEAAPGERELALLIQEVAAGEDDRLFIYRAALRRLAEDHEEGN